MNLRFFNSSLNIKLLRIFKANKISPQWKNKNLNIFLKDQRLLIYAYKNLWKSSTHRLSNWTIFKIVRDLSNETTYDDYRWKKVYWKKADKKLFLATYSFKDQIMQKAIITLLNVIYKPVFNSRNALVTKSTYFTGLRIKQLKRERQNFKYAFQNKIQQHSTNISSITLIKILRKKIEDKKLLQLIKSFLNHNTVSEIKKVNLKLLNESLLGSKLVDVYLHELDLYVHKKIKKLHIINQQLNLQYTWRIWLYKKFNTENSIKNSKFTMATVKQAMKNKRLRVKLKIQLKWRQVCKIKFYWYKTNWILFSNLNNSTAKKLNRQIYNWANKKLNLVVDTKRQRVANLNKVKLALQGFAVFNKQKQLNSFKYKNNIIVYKKSYPVLFLGIDHKYLKRKLVKLKVIDKKYKPVYLLRYVNLKPSNMLLKFTQNLTQIIKFYRKNIDCFNDFRFYYYAYKFSYLKTLSYRTKKSITYLSFTKHRENFNLWFPSYYTLLNGRKRF